MCVFSSVQLFLIPWAVVHQAPLFMEFSRQEYWSGLPFLSPGDLCEPGIKPESFVSPALAGRFFTTEPPGKPMSVCGYLVSSDIPTSLTLAFREVHLWIKLLVCRGLILHSSWFPKKKHVNKKRERASLIKPTRTTVAYILVCACTHSCFSHIRLFATVARQAPLSMGFSRQEYWSGLPCTPSGDLPKPGVKPESLMSFALA